MNETIKTFIKISESKYANDLQNGNMYFNTPGYFKKCENEAQRDNFEGIDFLHQAEKISSIKIESSMITPIIFNKDNGLINLKLANGITEKFNIFCMYIWSVNKYDHKIDDRILKLGDTALIITNQEEFINRVIKAVKHNNIDCKYRPVEYYDEHTYSGDIGVFKKRKSLDYMNEFRIAVKAKMDNCPYILNIGDIRDISVIMKSQDINSLAIE